jgi:predicted transcriptional regulator
MLRFINVSINVSETKFTISIYKKEHKLTQKSVKMKELEYVKKSQYRIKIIKSINEHPKIPSQIAKETSIISTHVSKTLGALEGHGLVVCLNPDAYRGRVYRLSEMGKKVADRL